MSKIWIGTSITENYVNGSIGFLESLSKFHDHNFCVCYGFAPTTLANKFKNITFYFLERKYTEIGGIIQWGTWLKAIPYNNDDIYIMSDADMVIQRPLNTMEINKFSNYDDNVVGCSINAHNNDNLGEEGGRIGIRTGFNFNHKSLLVNTGVMVARPKFFETLTPHMDKMIPKFNEYSGHRSRGQFLICHIIDLLKIQIDLLSQEFHSHGHFGLPKDCKFNNSKLFYKNELVMFRHRL